MKRSISFCLSFVILACLSVPAFASDSAASTAPGKDIVLEEYSLTDSDLVFTMDLFEQTYTRKDVANMNAFATNDVSSAAYQEQIIGIETSYFFNGILGTYYIYFGRPNCPECIEFEPHLLEALEDNNQVVYYYNTSYWKDKSQYDRILSKYHVDSVPLLVKTVNGEYRDAYQFDPNATAEETKMQLGDFFIKRSNLFPVTTEGNFPMQFHDYLFTLTFFIMCINVCYLVLKQKDLVAAGYRSPLAWIVVNSTLLFALHIAIAGFGFGFAMQYEATPATSLFSKIGTYTWLIPTPLLYFITLGLAVKIILKQDEAKSDK